MTEMAKQNAVTSRPATNPATPPAKSEAAVEKKEVKYEELVIDPPKPKSGEEPKQTLSPEEIFKSKVIDQSKDQPVIVHVSGSRCNPSQELTKQFPGFLTKNHLNARLLNMDVYEVGALSPEAKERVGMDKVKNLPTVLLYRNGKMVDQFAGFPKDPKVGEESLKAFFSKNSNSMLQVPPTSSK